jgi:hypothetical protein
MVVETALREIGHPHSEKSKLYPLYDFLTRNNLASSPMSDKDYVFSRIAKRFEYARSRQSKAVIFSAMEMPLSDKNGKRLAVSGGRAGGQSVWMSDVPYQVWKDQQTAIGSFVVTPLFWNNIRKNYGTLHDFMEAYDASIFTQLNIPVGLGTLPITVIYAEQEEAYLYFYCMKKMVLFFNELYHMEYTDSFVGYIETILLSRAAL